MSDIETEHGGRSSQLKWIQMMIFHWGERSFQNWSKRRNCHKQRLTISYHCSITLVKHTAHMSMAAANVSSLGKITDPATFKMILRASIQPMVQLSIPDRFLDPKKDPEVDHSQLSILKKIEVDLLLMSNKAVLAKEPVNGPDMVTLHCSLVKAELHNTKQGHTERGHSKVPGLRKVAIKTHYWEEVFWRKDRETCQGQEEKALKEHLKHKRKVTEMVTKEDDDDDGNDNDTCQKVKNYPH